MSYWMAGMAGDENKQIFENVLLMDLVGKIEYLEDVSEVWIGIIAVANANPGWLPILRLDKDLGSLG